MSERPTIMNGLHRCCMNAVDDYIGPEEWGITVIECSTDGQQIRLNEHGYWVRTAVEADA